MWQRSEAKGKDFVINNNLIKKAGAYPGTGSQPQSWADGITAIRCQRSTLQLGQITNNKIIDATDVGIALGGTSVTAPSTSGRCTVTGNEITQINSHAFSAIGVSQFGMTGAGFGLHYGSMISNNTITGNGLMDFGIHAGKHPWDATACTKGGTISNNAISGAFTNLNVDGWQDGTVQGNTLSSPQGSAILLGGYDNAGSGCTFTLSQRNFTFGDAINVIKSGQAGTPTSVIFHSGHCIFNPTMPQC